MLAGTVGCRLVGYRLGSKIKITQKHLLAPLFLASLPVGGMIKSKPIRSRIPPLNASPSLRLSYRSNVPFRLICPLSCFPYHRFASKLNTQSVIKLLLLDPLLQHRVSGASGTQRRRRHRDGQLVLSVQLPGLRQLILGRHSLGSAFPRFREGF